jgi:hypothetical protein
LGFAKEAILPGIQRTLNPAFRIQPIREGENPHIIKRNILESGWWTDLNTVGQFAIHLETEAVKDTMCRREYII